MTGIPYVGSFTVAQLNAMTGVAPFTHAWATNACCLVGGNTLSNTFTKETTGKGTGCMVTTQAGTSGSATAWQYPGTNVTVTA